MVSHSTREGIRKGEVESNRKMRITLALVLLGIVFAVYRLYTIDRSDDVDVIVEKLRFPNREAETLAEELNPQLRLAFATVLSEDKTLASRLEALGYIAKSNDSMIDAVLLNAASQAESQAVFASAENLLVDKSNPESKFGERLIKEWLVEIRLSQGRAANYAPFTQLLQANSTEVPLERRISALEEALEKEPYVGLNLALAISEEGAHKKEFEKVIRNYLAKEANNQAVHSVRLSALILGVEVFDPRFTTRAIRDFDSLASADLRWVMSRVVKFEQDSFVSFVKRLLEREGIPAFQRVLLEILAEPMNRDAPLAVKQGVVHASFGRATSDDVAAIANWISTEREKALLVICATSSDESVALQAFDSLAGITLRTEPAKSLVSWVRDSAWEKRNRAVRSIGVLGFAPSATNEQIEAAFDNLVPLSAKGFLYNAVSQSGNLRLIKIALDRYGAVLPSTKLLEFLKDEDKELRVAALRGLAGRNNIQVLHKIAEAYEDETEEEVRQVYRELHWVARQRQRQKEGE